MTYDRLKELTKQLKDYNKQAHDQYVTRTVKEVYEADFYAEVKPFLDKVEKIADEWKPLAREWALKEKPKYVYPIQINDTHENITISAVLCFQKETMKKIKEKRFLEMIQSIEYVLNAILDQV